MLSTDHRGSTFSGLGECPSISILDMGISSSTLGFNETINDLYWNTSLVDDTATIDFYVGGADGTEALAEIWDMSEVGIDNLTYAQGNVSNFTTYFGDGSGLTGVGNQSFNQSLTDSIYIAQSEEANLNVNSSNWWSGISGWVSGWFVQTGNNLEFNETKLNETIDARDSDTPYSHLTNFTDDLGDRGYDSLSNFTNDEDFINSTQAQEYNETDYIDGIISDNNASWISTYNATYDAKVTDNESWNQSFADTLYAVFGYGDDWNKTFADTLYADISVTGDNSSWNQSLADTLYAGIEWDYNQTTPALLQVLDWSYYNATNFNITDYSTTANILAFGYYNSSDFVITDYFTKSDVLGLNYYNSSDFSIADYSTTTEILAFNYYNSSDFNISDYVTSATLSGYGYYNSSDFSISDYYTKAEIEGFGYYNSSNPQTETDPVWTADKTDYSTTAQADLLYAGIEWDYNQTTPAISYVDGLGWQNTYNVTYDANVYVGSYNSTYTEFAYNQSSPYDNYNYNMSDGNDGGAMDYTNIAMTNISEVFDYNLNVSGNLTVGSGKLI